MLCRKKICRITAVTVLKKALPHILPAIALSVLCGAAEAAMPGANLNSNPFELAQNALSTLIEGGISLGKWLAMAAAVTLGLVAICNDHIDKKPIWRIATILVIFSCLSWIIELFLMVA